MGRTEQARSAGDGAGLLSDREVEVLLLVARGLSNRQIAKSLFIAEATVKRHLANVYPKLGVNSRAQAMREALATGLISPVDLTREDGG